MNRIHLVIFFTVSIILSSGCINPERISDNDNEEITEGKIAETMFHYDFSLEIFSNPNEDINITVPIPINSIGSDIPKVSMIVYNFIAKYRNCLLVYTEYGVGLKVHFNKGEYKKFIIVNFTKAGNKYFDNDYAVEEMSMKEKFPYNYYFFTNKNVTINYSYNSYRIQNGKMKGISFSPDDGGIIDTFTFDNQTLLNGWNIVSKE